MEDNISIFEMNFDEELVLYTNLIGFRRMVKTIGLRAFIFVAAPKSIRKFGKITFLPFNFLSIDKRAL